MGSDIFFLASFLVKIHHFSWKLINNWPITMYNHIMTDYEWILEQSNMCKWHCNQDLLFMGSNIFILTSFLVKISHIWWKSIDKWPITMYNLIRSDYEWKLEQSNNVQWHHNPDRLVIGVKYHRFVLNFGQSI